MAADFTLPFVALNIALRNTKLTVETRMGLIRTAFIVFFEMAINYPRTGHGRGIDERGGPNDVKTSSTRALLKRVCNLCVGIDWLLHKWGMSGEFWLALARLETHPVECNFGTTRSTLNGDLNWTRFFAAQLTAAIAHRITWQFGIRLHCPDDLRRDRYGAQKPGGLARLI
jgi:hypothetical protein